MLGRISWISIGIALAIAVLFPLLSGMSFHVLNVAIIMLIFILFSSAWNFLAYSGQASLGHAAFFGIGGYISTILARSAGYASFATILAGGCVAAFVGFLLGLTCVRLKEWFLAMVTFGFAVILQVVVATTLAETTGGWDGMISPRLIPISLDNYLVIEYYVILAATIVSIIAIYLILRSRAGLAFAAIRENEVEAQAAGINPVSWKLIAFTISSFLAGIAGALMVHHIGFISPEIFSAENSFWPVIYSIFGGLGTISGPIIGTTILTIVWDGLKELGLTYERFIIIGLLLIVVVIFLPRGLVSLPEKIRERLAQRKKG
ncbi:MAG: branched-chain amino acid ABC transporter permease [Methanomicrobiales archaeon]|nr:branched-chain amino acid ABC transporter permease [Methanomicrobiales archaeon]MDD1646615.1 branched-chain amino acid ABC transporter permease [Methanomicrobiales archaeon]